MKFNVHAFAQVRIKAVGIEAGSHAEAIRVFDHDDALQSEIARVINRDDIAGPIEAVEYQQDDIPTGYIVDVQRDEIDYTDSVSFNVDRRGEAHPQTATSWMPTAWQDQILTSWGDGSLKSLITAAGTIESTASRMRDRDACVPAAVFEDLTGATTTEEALRRIDETMRSLHVVRDAIAAMTAPAGEQPQPALD